MRELPSCLFCPFGLNSSPAVKKKQFADNNQFPPHKSQFGPQICEF